MLRPLLLLLTTVACGRPAPVDAQLLGPAGLQITNDRHADPGRRQLGPAGPGQIPPPGVCASSDLVGLDAAGLVTYLESNPLDCLDYLFAFDGDVAATVTDDALVLAVLSRIELLAASWDGSNDTGLAQLLRFVHAQGFHGFYEDAVFTTTDVADAQIGAFNALHNSVHVVPSTAESAVVVGELVAAVDSTDLVSRYASTHGDILADLTNHVGSEEHEVLAWRIALAFQRPLYNLDPAFAAVADLALLDDVDAAATLPRLPNWLRNNLIWTVGHFVLPAATEVAARRRLTGYLSRFDRLSEPWLWTVAALDEFSGCQTSTPSLRLCRADVRGEVLDLVFPNTWSFDDGAMVMRTPLPRWRAVQLYHGLQQTEATASRVLHRIAPVPGDGSEVLSLYIYDNAAAYEAYQPWLFELPVDNGGLHVEPDASLYTYDRPDRSALSLEAILRHEYSHHLIGRHLVDGLWGHAPVYAAGRMVWFDEGLAEALAGADHTGLTVRRALLDDLSNSNLQHTVASVLSSAYGDPDLYPSTGLLLTWLAEARPTDLYEIVEAIGAGDVARLDVAVADLSADSSAEVAWQAWLALHLRARTTFVDPEPLSGAIEPMPVVAPRQLERRFEQHRLVSDARCTVSVSNLVPRFTCLGSWSAAAGARDAAAWRVFDARAGELARDLDGAVLQSTRAGRDNTERPGGIRPSLTTATAWHGTSCRFGETRREPLGPSTTPVTTWVCEGPTGRLDHAPNPVQRATDDAQTLRGMGAALCIALGDDVRCSAPLLSTVSVVSAATSTLEGERARIEESLYALGSGRYGSVQCSLGSVGTSTRGTSTIAAATITCDLGSLPPR